MEKRDVVILGGGPSGLYAAAYAALRGLSALVVEANTDAGGQPRHLYGHKRVVDFPALLEASGETIAAALEKQLRGAGGKLIVGRRLTGWSRLPDGGIKAVLDDGSEYATKALVIATGNGSLQPIELEQKLLGADVEPSKIAYRVKDFSAYAGKRVVILGGGDSAVEWAAQLSDKNGGADCLSVAVVHRRDTYRAGSKYVQQMRANGVIEHLGCTLTSVGRDALSVKGADETEKSVPYDALIVQYGLRQVKHGREEWKTLDRVGGRFATDRNMQTSEKGIYAIGAATHFQGRPNLLVVGMAEAATAIKHVSDQINPYAQDYVSGAVE